MRERKSRDEDAVSEIVGEMLMLAMVLVVLAVISSSMSDYLPPPRDPSVTIRMSSIHGANVTLFHKGGDAIKTSEISVIIGGNTETKRFTGYGENVTFIGYEGTINPPLFDLGDNVEVRGVSSGDKVSLVTPRAVIYQGGVP